MIIQQIVFDIRNAKKSVISRKFDAACQVSRFFDFSWQDFAFDFRHAEKIKKPEKVACTDVEYIFYRCLKILR